jgi:ubiquinone/menaquinone biosynthesis C-methylase UbiE
LEREVYRKFFELERENWWFSGMRSIYDRQIKRLKSSAALERILDVGCGTGVWTKQLGQFGSAVAIDFSKEALLFCRARGLSNLLQASACEIPFHSDTFSLVTAFGVIEHVEEDQGMLSELYRVCRPGGYVLLLTSAYQFLWSYHDDFVHHKRRYLRSELLSKVEGAGFDVCKISYVNSILFPGIAGVRMLQRIGRFRPQRAEEVTDIFDVKGVLNRVLRSVLEAEAFLLQFVSFPFGVGLMCIARKSEGSG